jgi:hypothetical protein
MGRLLTLNRRLDEDTGPNAGGPLHRRRAGAGRAAGSVTPAPGGGAWVLRIEPAGGASTVDDAGDAS